MLRLGPHNYPYQIYRKPGRKNADQPTVLLQPGTWTIGASPKKTTPETNPRIRNIPSKWCLHKMNYLRTGMWSQMPFLSWALGWFGGPHILKKSLHTGPWACRQFATTSTPRSSDAEPNVKSMRRTAVDLRRVWALVQFQILNAKKLPTFPTCYTVLEGFLKCKEDHVCTWIEDFARNTLLPWE